MLRYQVSDILRLWGVAGVDAVPRCDLWAGPRGLSLTLAV